MYWLKYLLERKDFEYSFGKQISLWNCDSLNDVWELAFEKSFLCDDLAVSFADIGDNIQRVTVGDTGGINLKCFLSIKMWHYNNIELFVNY